MEHEGVECCGRGRFHPPPPLQLRGSHWTPENKGKNKEIHQSVLFFTQLADFCSREGTCRGFGLSLPCVVRPLPVLPDFSKFGVIDAHFGVISANLVPWQRAFGEQPNHSLSVFEGQRLSHVPAVLLCPSQGLSLKAEINYTLQL